MVEEATKTKLLEVSEKLYGCLRTRQYVSSRGRALKFIQQNGAIADGIIIEVICKKGLNGDGAKREGYGKVT